MFLLVLGQSVFIQPQSPGALRSFLVVFLGVVFSRGLTRMTRVFEILSCLLSCMERPFLPEVVFLVFQKNKNATSDFYRRCDLSALPNEVLFISDTFMRRWLCLELGGWSLGPFC